MLTVGSLFSGIEGFGLGLERTGGFRIAWHCEQDHYCQRIIGRHWPDNPIYDDVRAIGAHNVEPVDVLCGGFPCQDLSLAGSGAGLDGERSGLWSEYARLIGELRPRYVIVENVAALLSRGLGRVLGDLAALGYDAEWDCIPASAVGAPHRRDRIWLVAYPQRQGLEGPRREPGRDQTEVARSCDEGSGGNVAHADRERWQRRTRQQRQRGRGEPAHGRPRSHSWTAEPDVGRVAHGIPARVDRLRALGNALVPQIPEWIGGRILAHEAQEGRLAA